MLPLQKSWPDHLWTLTTQQESAGRGQSGRWFPLSPYTLLGSSIPEEVTYRGGRKKKCYTCNELLFTINTPVYRVPVGLQLPGCQECCAVDGWPASSSAPRKERSRWDWGAWVRSGQLDRCTGGILDMYSDTKRQLENRDREQEMLTLCVLQTVFFPPTDKWCLSHLWGIPTRSHCSA